MKLRTLLLVALVLFVGLTSVSVAGMNRQRRAGAGLRATQPTDVEIVNLWHMRQEEKLARDVYLTLNDEWEVVTFANISNSEQRHMDAIKRLMDLYNLEDPVEGKDIGEFEEPAFANLYLELTELGKKSLNDAFGVGITIEELDIADLNEKIEETTSTNIKRVFENLLAGSENHLAAFEYNLENYDPDAEQTCVNGGKQRMGRNRQGRNGQGQNGLGLNGQRRNRQGRNGYGRNRQGRNRQECIYDNTCINQ